MADTFIDLPDYLQPIIQEGHLERAFQQALLPRMAYRLDADREDFEGSIGETKTKTRFGRKPPVTTPLSPAATHTDLDNGMTATDPPVEQYVYTLLDIGDLLKLDLKQSKATIMSRFLKYAQTNAIQGSQSVEWLVRNGLFDGYMGGDTRCVTDNGASGALYAFVDDVRGFEELLAKGKVVSVSGTNYLTATVSGSQDATVRVVSVDRDVSNVSTNAAGGISGKLTFASGHGATLVDGDRIVAINAPYIVRAGGRSSFNLLNSGDLWKFSHIRAAKAYLSKQGVDPFADGYYHIIADDDSMNQLFDDPQFIAAYQSEYKSREIQKGEMVTLFGCKFINTTEAFQQAAVDGTGAQNVPRGVKRPIMLGGGAVVQADFAGNSGFLEEVGGSKLADMRMIEDIMMITVAPQDALQRNIKQAWNWTGAIGIPSDATTTPQVTPTASNARFKRAVVMEHAV